MFCLVEARSKEPPGVRLWWDWIKPKGPKEGFPRIRYTKVVLYLAQEEAHPPRTFPLTNTCASVVVIGSLFLFDSERIVGVSPYLSQDSAG